MKNEDEAKSTFTSATQIKFDIYSKSGVKLNMFSFSGPYSKPKIYVLWDLGSFWETNTKAS